MRKTSIPTFHAEPASGQGDEATSFPLIREQGDVPAIVLGQGAARQILSLDAAEVGQAVQVDEHAVVRIELSAETFWARIADVERDPQGQTVRHVELTRLPKGEVVVVDVPIEVHRKSASRWAHAPLESLESVRIEGPVEEIPDVLEVNAQRLQPHESITLGELHLPRYCEPVDLPLDTPVVTVLFFGEHVQAEDETISRKS